MPDWKALRRLALLVGRHRLASEERGTIKLRSLASDPAARYPTATAFREALRRSQGFLRRLRAFLRSD